MRHPRLSEIAKQLRAGLEALYGARLARVVLYGSQARAQARPRSDIDVLVVLKGPVSVSDEIDRTSDLIWRVSLEYDVTVSRLFKSEAAFRKEQSPLLMNVRREGVPL